MLYSNIRLNLRHGCKREQRQQTARIKAYNYNQRQQTARIKAYNYDQSKFIERVKSR